MLLKSILKAKIIVLGLILFSTFGAQSAKAQVNAQLFYDFGDDREFLTLTLEMFKGDKWGSTYFFIDHDLDRKSVV